MPKRKKKKGYVNNEELVKEIVRYKKTGIYSDRLAEMLMAMIKRIGSRGQFCGYTFLDDMKSDALLTCLKYLHNFKPEKNNNAFAYITMIIFNSFKMTIKKEKKHSVIKDKMYKERQDQIATEVSSRI